MDDVVFAYIEEPPFVSDRGSDWPGGCDADVAAAVLRLMGVSGAKHRLVTFQELLPGVLEGRWTFNTPLFVTKERARAVRFSHPVWGLPDGLLVRQEDQKVYRSYEDIAKDDGAYLGVVQGQVQAETATKAGIPQSRIIAFKTPEEVIAAMLSGRVVAYASVARAHRQAVDLSVSTMALSDLGEERHKDRAGHTPALGAFSFSKKNERFAEQFDAALDRFLGSDQHIQMMARYGFSVSGRLATG